MQENLTLPSEILEPHIIKASLENKSFFLKILPYLKTSGEKSYFNNSNFQMIFNIIATFFEKKKLYPSEDEIKYFAEKLYSKDENRKNLVISACEKIFKGLPEKFSIELLEEETINFIKKNRSYEAFVKAQASIQEKNYDAVVPIFEEAVRVNFDKDLGFFIRNFDEAVERMDTIRDVSSIDSGLPSLNMALSGGFHPSELYIFSGIPGLFKTGLMGNFAINAFKQGKKVLVYTFETSVTRLIQRYYSNILKENKTTLIAMGETLKDKAKEIMDSYTGDMIIKEYEANKASAADLMAHIYDLELYYEWKPDLIIIDYLLIMKTTDPRLSSENSYKYYKTVSEEVRNIAKVLKIPVISATQINRSGQDDLGGSKQLTTSKDMSESRGIFDTCDLFATLNQTARMKQKEALMIYVDKNRNGETGQKINCVIDYDRMTIEETRT